jgi:hypothetical protein
MGQRTILRLNCKIEEEFEKKVAKKKKKVKSCWSGFSSFLKWSQLFRKLE